MSARASGAGEQNLRVHQDRYGLSVTTTSHAAFADYSEALDLALAHQDGAVLLLRRALESDERFALAWALLGLQQRAAGDIPGGSESLKRARARAADLSDRERSYLGVLERFTVGDVGGTESAVHAHLDDWPRDAVIVMQAHFLYNLFDPRMDRDERLLALDEKVAPSYGDDWFMLGELAFAFEENGDYERARDLAAGSLEANPMNGFAAHPLAHVYLETGDVDAGSSWLRRWLSVWEHPSMFACHLTWHLALLRLAADDAQDAIRLLDEIAGYAGRSIGALTDGASLAWRLRLDGIDTETPLWDLLVGLPDRPGFTFGNAHHALALAGARNAAALRDYSESLDRLASDGHPTAGACAEFARALGDLVLGDNEQAVDRLVMLYPQFRTFGGSRAQTEVFEDTLIAALERAGRQPAAIELLATRMARRSSARDERWLTRLG